ncbi:phospholipase D family protein [Methanonatronarchaeum sp. AMET-Sl]|uniref:phospholipase D family protein n=1 Tax=Methanonatronarchaeum sp. AMET-Sl TaxID=3037654 RepID=UPI00244DB947|nr:phospholipase D family protein [Methanonatronarchaeum sp. AMET-Sl]WGI18006.1 phospholipase D family protein [Methanonatronarchaeum sp. AMET-Sl]
MADFLRTNQISSKIEDIIDGADDNLILMSPYLQINKKIKNRLKVKNNRKKFAKIVYRKNKLEKKEREWLSELEYIKTSYHEDLHAKCYLNEKEAIITSMNLYQHSQENNYEMGVYINKKQDPELYNDLKKEIDFIVETAKDTDPKQKTQKQQKNNKKGYCIRCKKKIKLNPKTPYCRKCYKKWNKYKNKDYKEKYCHICKKEKETTKNKPVCYKCYKKHKNKLKFPKNKKN